VEWDDNFLGAHQVTLPKITSDHVPILLHVGDIPLVKRPFRFENVWFEVEDFPHLVKTWWDQFHISGSHSYMLAKKLNLLKLKFKDWNRNVFRHLDTRMVDSLEKVKLSDAKEQQLSLTHSGRVQRFDLKKELTLLRDRADIFRGNEPTNIGCNKEIGIPNFSIEWRTLEENLMPFGLSK